MLKVAIPSVSVPTDAMPREAAVDGRHVPFVMSAAAGVVRREIGGESEATLLESEREVARLGRRQAILRRTNWTETSKIRIFFNLAHACGLVPRS